MSNTAEKTQLKNPGRFRRGFRRFYAQRYLQAFAILGAIYIIVFYYVPMLGIQIAFRNYKPNMGFAGIFNAPLADEDGF